MTNEYKGALDAALKKGAKLVTGRGTVTSTETYKIGDNYIKVGKEETFEWTYSEGADVHEVNIAMDAYSCASVAHSIAEQKLEKGISGKAKPEAVATVPESSTAGFGVPTEEIVADPAKAPSMLEKPIPMEVVQFKLELRTDKKFQLELTQMYGQKIGDYPDIKFVASHIDMWNMLGELIGTFDTSVLPVKYACKWYADWEHGREYKNNKGETKNYKDLTGLRQR